jgi:hypothetical protein
MLRVINLGDSFLNDFLINTFQILFLTLNHGPCFTTAVAVKGVNPVKSYFYFYLPPCTSHPIHRIAETHYGEDLRPRLSGATSLGIPGPGLAQFLPRHPEPHNL